jgi:hypothetical protein
MKCNQLICAQSVVTDKTTNQVSIFNIFENGISSLFPFQIPLVTLFIQLEKETGEPLTFNFNLIINLDEVNLYQQPVSISFLEGDLRNNTTINMQGLVISKPGTLTFIVEFDGVFQKTYSFRILHKQV